MKVLVLGGTRFVGLRVCELLVGAGAQVTVLHRGVTGSPVAGTTTVAGDRSQPDGLAGLGEARFDAVLDLSGYFSDWTRQARESLKGRISNYVFVSSGAVYRPSAELPWPESTPYGPIPIWGRYGEEKVASEKILFEAYAAGEFAVTCFRFPFILGPANFADRESFVFSRLEAYRPILLPEGGSAINQFVYLDDVARALVTALERPEVAAGQAYNCTYARALTNRGFVELCAEVLDIEARIVPVDEEALGVASATVDLTNLVFPYPAQHYMLDGTKLGRELGVEMRTGHRRMIEEYASWWESASDHTPRRYEREDKALEALRLKT